VKHAETMTDTETKYKTLIDKLRAEKPVAGNPVIMTDEIMHSISLQHKKAMPGFLVWFRPLMTAAALFFFSLFLYQQVESTDKIFDNAHVKHINPSLIIKPDCNSDSTMSLSENRELLKQYICYMRSNIVENENSKQFYHKYLPKY
jgi:hypothetical protein